MTPQDQSWSSYPETVLTFRAGEDFSVDLRRSLRATDRGRLRRAGFGGTFAVVTACNPRGGRATGRENARRTNELRALIALHGVPALPADGGSPDGKHVEPGFAAVLPKDEALRIARYFEQTACFWFDGRRFWIEPVVAGYGRVALPQRG